MNDKLGYSIKEAAESLSISVWKIKDEMYQGRIKYIKIGTRVVIPRGGELVNDKLGYSIKEAAEAISISVSKLKEEMYQGRIRYIKIGTRVVIPHWALEERLRPEAVKLLPDGDGDGQEHAED